MDIVKKGFWTKAETWAALTRRLIYIVCFAWLIYLDHIIGSAHGWTQVTLKQYTGVVFAIIVLTAYKAKDFLKIPYLVWTVLFFVLKPFVIEWAWENHYLVAGVYPVSRFTAYVWNVGIYGIVFIRMFYAYVIEKVKPRMNWPIFAVWLAMMLGMILSVNDGTWFYSFLLIFGCFYLTNFTKKQLNTLFIGMVEGIILGFLLLQWQALLHRPYDELRYEGMYANCNINALFYTVSYLAVLGKWYLMKLKRRPFIMKVPLVLLGGSIWALTVFTMCRAALISMTLITVLFVAFQVISVKRRKVLEVVKITVFSLLSIVIMFKPTYNLVRYVPAYANSPIYFVLEDPEKKVLVDEAFDSEKYIEYEEMLEAAFGRIFVLRVNASESTQPLTEDATINNNSVKIRELIYQYYWSQLNFKGHTMEEHGVWVTKSYNAPHAHNILLQLTFDHGVIVGILFVAMILLTLYTVGKGIVSRKSGPRYYRLFLVAGMVIALMTFGMFELCWVYGQIGFTLLFVAFRSACRRDEY